ncbi:MAG: NAD(P)/FAD-dependent oxidoreductase [Bryobacterales bacterium]|nr:NAD(P)/FAD-dependent oxidoreductase [Bryobacterales bacterium]
MNERQEFDVVVAGAGPAGIAAACAAAESGAAVGLIDDNSEPGGQVWRRDRSHAPSQLARFWLNRLERASIHRFSQTRIVAATARSRVLVVEQPRGSFEVSYRKLVLATGARERFLPFPGWTLPGVVGAGGLQALVKSGLDVQGARIVVAGTGPLLLAAASHLRLAGARIQAIVEQAPLPSLTRFALQSARYGKAAQALGLGLDLIGVPLHVSSWIEAAEGARRVSAVRVRVLKKVKTYPCDYVATSFGLAPNIELPVLAGCEIEDGFVAVTGGQRTSVKDVYAAGEITGIGGVDSALAEGQEAGSGNALGADRWLPFKRLLHDTFNPRDELRSLAAPETIVCRCEDVRRSALDGMTCWREAKLQTRCGMGTCQGRVCGAALQFLNGWRNESVRPPLLPARVETLANPGRRSR